MNLKITLPILLLSTNMNAATISDLEDKYYDNFDIFDSLTLSEGSFKTQSTYRETKYTFERLLEDVDVCQVELRTKMTSESAGSGETNTMDIISKGTFNMADIEQVEGGDHVSFSVSTLDMTDSNDNEFLVMYKNNAESSVVTALRRMKRTCRKYNRLIKQ